MPNSQLLVWLLPLLEVVINQATPFLRSMLVKAILDIEAKAKETPNQWDNLLADLLKVLLLVKE